MPGCGREISDAGVVIHDICKGKHLCTVAVAEWSHNREMQVQKESWDFEKGSP